MAIKVKCNCGKAFGAPENYAGKRVKCPNCGEPLLIPNTEGSATLPKTEATEAGAGTKAATGSIGDLLDEADLGATNTGQRCPECRNDLGPDDILCIKCGYRMDRGSKMETKRVVKPKGLSISAGPSQGNNAPKAVQDLHGSLRVLGFLNLAAGILALVFWVAVFATGSVQVEFPPELAGLLATMALVGGLMATISIWLIFFTAKKVIEGKSLGRILSIVVSVLYLPSFPIGTIIGVYLLVKSLSADVAAYCSR